jgi:hypothetical protein
MSSSITPPPTGGGNGKYVAIVVVLLGGMGALLYWKMSSSPDVQKPLVVTVDAAPPPTFSHVDDEVPPPPIIPDAGPDTGPVRNTTNTGTAYNACASTAKCNGTATGDLESALAFRAKQAHRCYDSALANDSTLKGRVGISVRVASNGQVCSASVASNDMGSASVGSCVANMFRQSGHFPPPAGGCVDATVPISFVPGGH